MMPLYKSLIFWILLLVSSSSVLAFRYSFFLFLKCLLVSYLTLFRLSTWLWFGSCTHCILASFLGSKKKVNIHQTMGYAASICIDLRLSVAEVLIFTLHFSQILFMSSLSFTFSKAATCLKF